MLLREGCDAYHGPSCRKLGIVLRDGEHGVEPMPEASIPYLNRAEVQGDARATYELGVSYRDGLGTSPQYPIAADQFESACQRELMEGCYHLGMLLTQGQLPLDVERAGRAFLSGCG